MGRYISERPCSRHGSIVERYIKTNVCCACHSESMARYNAKKRNDPSVTCRRCGQPLTSGYCKPCNDRYLIERQTVPCPICRCVNRDSAGRCLECGKKMFGRTVPKKKRADLIAFLQAINLTYGVTTGDYSFGRVVFDGKHWQQVVEFITGG